MIPGSSERYLRSWTMSGIQDIIQNSSYPALKAVRDRNQDSFRASSGFFQGGPVPKDFWDMTVP
jgi:hypothetical protein